MALFRFLLLGLVLIGRIRSADSLGSPVVMEFNITHSYSRLFSWIVTDTISALNSTFVEFNVTAQKVPRISIFVLGLINITNTGDGDTTLGNIVVNLQQSGFNSGFMSVCSNMFTRSQGESAQSSRVVAGLVSDPSVCSVNASSSERECLIPKNTCYQSLDRDCLCSGNMRVFLDGQLMETWTASVNPTIPPGESVLLTLESWFNASAMGIEPSSSLRVEVLVTFSQAQTSSEDAVSGSMVDVDGDGLPEANVSSLAIWDEFNLASEPVVCNDGLSVLNYISVTDGLEPISTGWSSNLLVRRVNALLQTSDCYDSCSVLHSLAISPEAGSVSGLLEGTLAAYAIDDPTTLTISLSDDHIWKVWDCIRLDEHLDTNLVLPVHVVNGAFVTDEELHIPQPNETCTYTQNQWATDPTLLSHFDSYYKPPLYLTLGSPDDSYVQIQSASEAMRLMSRSLVNDFIMDTALSSDQHTFLGLPVQAQGVHMHQLMSQPLLALRLNLDLFPAYGELFVCVPSNDIYFFIHGMQIKTLYQWFQNMLGGGKPLRGSVTEPFLSQRTLADDYFLFLDLAGYLAGAYQNCEATTWASVSLSSDACL